jgi:hypothetical protein
LGDPGPDGCKAQGLQEILVDECLLDRSPYPIESECGREWNSEAPTRKKCRCGRLVAW